MLSPFGSMHRVKGVQLKGFDSAVDAVKDSADMSVSQSREQQSVIEEVRQTALHIMTDVVNAVVDGTLDDDELPSDRLDSLMSEALDGIDGEDSKLWEGALSGSIADAFESLGVDSSVVSEMFGEDVEAADAAIEAAAETAIANLPDEGEAMDEFTREFIFGEADSMGGAEEGFDAVSKAMAHAKNGAFSHRKVGGKNIAYKGVIAIRHGIKAIVNKRLPNQKVRLSAGQKSGLKKARLHAYTANAINKRKKSFKKGRKMGLY